MEIHQNNLVCLLEECIAADADKVLFLFEGREITAAEIWENVHKLRAGFDQLGIHRGSRVLLMLPNIPEYVTAYFAILGAGAVVVPVNVMLKEREIHYLMPIICLPASS